MGVIQLWSILEPVKEQVPLVELSGLTLAVDLSIWICESNAIRQMQGVVTKPHLRNLFFRVSNLSQMGVQLIFAIEGEAPDLKTDTMSKRQQNRFPGKKTTTIPSKPKRKGRGQFNSILKECCAMLDYLGVPYIHSHGEAEALCAFLNYHGIVDGCLTDDGDAFLYGAKTVYRNFTLNTKDPHVESYRSDHIEDVIGLKREGLIGLALLLGCDYLPKGVPGVGKEQVLKLIKAMQGINILDRLKSWPTLDGSNLEGIEKAVWKKAIKVQDFPNFEVIDEFQTFKDRLPAKNLKQRRPWLQKSKDFLFTKLEWPPEYTEEKVLPLVTLWDMRDIVAGKPHNPTVHLEPHKIVKRRVRQGVPCLEVQWYRQDCTEEEEEFYSTIEEEQLFTLCFSTVVQTFEEVESNKKSTKGRKKGKAEGKGSKPQVDCVKSSDGKMDNPEIDVEKVIEENLLTGLENLHLEDQNIDIVQKTIKPSYRVRLLDPKFREDESESKTDSIPAVPESNLTSTSDVCPEYIPLSQRIKSTSSSRNQTSLSDLALDNCKSVKCEIETERIGTVPRTSYHGEKADPYKLSVRIIKNRNISKKPVPQDEYCDFGKTKQKCDIQTSRSKKTPTDLFSLDQEDKKTILCQFDSPMKTVNRLSLLDQSISAGDLSVDLFSPAQVNFKKEKLSYKKLERKFTPARDSMNISENSTINPTCDVFTPQSSLRPAYNLDVFSDTPNFSATSPRYGLFDIESSLLNTSSDVIDKTTPPDNCIELSPFKNSPLDVNQRCDRPKSGKITGRVLDGLNVHTKESHCENTDTSQSSAGTDHCDEVCESKPTKAEPKSKLYFEENKENTELCVKKEVPGSSPLALADRLKARIRGNISIQLSNNTINSVKGVSKMKVKHNQ